MDPRSLKFIADATGGKILNGAGDIVVSRVCTDSRQVQAGDLFIALAGDVQVRQRPPLRRGEEAIRVIKLMPKWKPGKQNGKAVNVAFTLPVKFRLD